VAQWKFNGRHIWDNRTTACRMLKKAVQQGPVNEEARPTVRYVELLSEARAPLADFFSILLEGHTRRAS
jgi:hypothetical protein